MSEEFAKITTRLRREYLDEAREFAGAQGVPLQWVLNRALQLFFAGGEEAALPSPPAKSADRDEGDAVPAEMPSEPMSRCSDALVPADETPAPEASPAPDEIPAPEAPPPGQMTLGDFAAEETPRYRAADFVAAWNAGVSEPVKRCLVGRERRQQDVIKWAKEYPDPEWWTWMARAFSQWDFRLNKWEGSSKGDLPWLMENSRKFEQWMENGQRLKRDGRLGVGFRPQRDVSDALTVGRQRMEAMYGADQEDDDGSADGPEYSPQRTGDDGGWSLSGHSSGHDFDDSPGRRFAQWAGFGSFRGGGAKV